MRDARPTFAPPVNPLVEAQQPGWCVYDERNDRFLTGIVAWGTARQAMVFGSRDAAQARALMLACRVASVPRFNGHVVEWMVLP